jgi:hypothetical protein
MRAAAHWDALRARRCGSLGAASLEEVDEGKLCGAFAGAALGWHAALKQGAAGLLH